MKEIILRLPEKPEITPLSFVLVVKYPHSAEFHANILPPARPAKSTKKPMNIKIKM